MYVNQNDVPVIDVDLEKRKVGHTIVNCALNPSDVTAGYFGYRGKIKKCF